MNKLACTAGLWLIALGTCSPLLASEPSIEGQVNGIELCPQFICGSALFTGVYGGHVDGRPAVGTWSASVNHEPLPELGDDPVAVLGGQWRLRVWVLRGFFPTRQSFSGAFGQGSLAAIEEHLFRVQVPMTIESGGTGPIKLELLLDENSIPQPVTGTLGQPTVE